MSLEELKRVVVIGAPCSGKTTFAYQLAQLMRVKHIELDTIYWLQYRIPRSHDEFRMLVKDAVAANEWVVDGYYGNTLGDICLSRVTTLIWLKYPWHVLFYRALRRLKERVIDRKGPKNYKTKKFRRAFLRIILNLFWVKVRHRNKRYARLLQEYQDRDLRIFVFRAPGEADRFLARLKQATEVNHPDPTAAQ